MDRSRAPVKGSLAAGAGGRGTSPPAHQAQERQLHVPGDPAAPEELPDQDVAHSRLGNRIHAYLHSIGNAIVPGGVPIHWSIF